jgi:hypothetical protein
MRIITPLGWAGRACELSFDENQATKLNADPMCFTLTILSDTPEGVYGRTLVMAYYKRTVRPRVERTAKAATRSDREQDEETLFYPYGIPLAA